MEVVNKIRCAVLFHFLFHCTLSEKLRKLLNFLSEAETLGGNRIFSCFENT